MMSKLYLITGFLGTGKTTFLKNLVKELSENRLHIIVNEFGKEGIDGELLKDLQITLDEINNGSIFCSCRLDQFETALCQVLLKQPDIILVETSGLSNPTNIRKILSNNEKFKAVDYMGCICLIDALQFPKVYETASVVKKQIGISDSIILNKIDMVSEEQLQNVRELLLSQRPDIPLFETSFGVIKKEWLEVMKKPERSQENPDIQNADITLRSYLITINDTFTYYSFQKFIEMIIENTYRMKGLVELEGSMYLLDCVGNLFKAEKYTGKVERKNVIVVLSGNAMHAKKAIKEAVKWYPEQVESVE